MRRARARLFQQTRVGKRDSSEKLSDGDSSQPVERATTAAAAAMEPRALGTPIDAVRGIGAPIGAHVYHLSGAIAKQPHVALVDRRTIVCGKAETRASNARVGNQTEDDRFKRFQRSLVERNARQATIRVV